MSDPIERYYEEFESRYAAVARPAERPVHRFPVRRVALVGAVAGLALGVAVAVLPGSDRGISTASAIEKAKAALSTEDAIVHIVAVTRQPLDGKLVTLRGETWLASDAARFSLDGEETAVRWYPRETSRDGKIRVRNDQFDPETNTHSFYWTRLDRDNWLFQADPTSAVRRLLASGKVTDEGVVNLNGREARKLVHRVAPTPPKQTGPNSGIGSTPGFVVEYYVDSESFAPVRTRSSYGDPASNQWIVTDFPRFERLPLTARNRKLLQLKVPAGAKTVDETKTWGELFKRR